MQTTDSERNHPLELSVDELDDQKKKSIFNIIDIALRKGCVSGSLMMSKLGSYARQNSLATALREMGRIEKTIFILDYISNETLRRRIQRGLNKGEAKKAMARNIFF